MSDLRDKIGKAMLRRFEHAYQTYSENYNPDTVWDAADEVVAELVSELTGQTATVKRHPRIIGSMGIELDPEVLR